ncbi:MAG: STAS domain-containing protein [candidate division Zixibacteria bacterium]|nr:STAS domain-containing protein [candidate division Zixibacteria bacterium]
MSDSQIRQELIDDGVVVLNPGRTLDNNNAHEMVEVISSTQEAGRNNIIIDMCDMEFISSAGVGSILGSVETSREAGGDIVLCNVSDAIMHVLVVLDLVDYLTIKTDRQQSAEFCGIPRG